MRSDYARVDAGSFGAQHAIVGEMGRVVARVGAVRSTRDGGEPALIHEGDVRNNLQLAGCENRRDEGSGEGDDGFKLHYCYWTRLG